MEQLVVVVGYFVDICGFSGDEAEPFGQGEGEELKLFVLGVEGMLDCLGFEGLKGKKVKKVVLIVPKDHVLGIENTGAFDTVLMLKGSQFLILVELSMMELCFLVSGLFREVH